LSSDDQTKLWTPETSGEAYDFDEPNTSHEAIPRKGVMLTQRQVPRLGYIDTFRQAARNAEVYDDIRALTRRASRLGVLIIDPELVRNPDFYQDEMELLIAYGRTMGKFIGDVHARISFLIGEEATAGNEFQFLQALLNQIEFNATGHELPTAISRLTLIDVIEDIMHDLAPGNMSFDTYIQKLRVSDSYKQMRQHVHMEVWEEEFEGALPFVRLAS